MFWGVCFVSLILALHRWQNEVLDTWLGFFEIPICIDIYCWIRLRKTYVRENVRMCVFWMDGFLCDSFKVLV